MFYEIRPYRLKNGAIPAYLKVVEEEGIAIQQSHLGERVGYCFFEIGPINEIDHIGALASLDERAERRAKLMAVPRWLSFLPKIRDLIEVAENKIMKPARFSPLV